MSSQKIVNKIFVMFMLHCFTASFHIDLCTWNLLWHWDATILTVAILWFFYFCMMSMSMFSSCYSLYDASRVMALLDQHCILWLWLVSHNVHNELTNTRDIDYKQLYFNGRSQATSNKRKRSWTDANRIEKR